GDVPDAVQVGRRIRPEHGPPEGQGRHFEDGGRPQHHARDREGAREHQGHVPLRHRGVSKTARLTGQARISLAYQWGPSTASTTAPSACLPSPRTKRSASTTTTSASSISCWGLSARDKG